MPKIKDTNRQKGSGAGPQMATGKEQPAPESSETQPQSIPFVQRGEEAPAKRRFSGFNLTEQGGIDWESMQAKSKAAFTEILKTDPQVQKITGRAAAEEEFPFQFTEQDARLALNVLNEVNSFTTRFFFGRFKNFPIDDDVAKAAFSFPHAKDCTNPFGKDCHCDEKILAERGARLANKYSGEWLRQHAELVMFCGLYFKCVTQQTMAAVEGQMIKNAIKAQQVRPNGHPAGPQAVQP